MNILIVDDNNDKIAKIVSVIKDSIENFNIDTVIDSIGAQIKLQNNKYDLLLLDLLLPLRADQDPIPDGGKKLLFEIERSKKIKTPTIIVGITQYQEYKDKFSSIWKLLFYNDVNWENELSLILKHTEKSIKYSSESVLLKKPTIIVEGETDAVILKEAISLYKSEYIDKIDIKFQKSAGANWVANQIVVWAKSLNKDKNGNLIKCIGLLDGDHAGIDANTEINRIVTSKSTGANSFRIIKLKPDYASNTISLYQKGLALPITLEELYPPDFWKYADSRNWLEERVKLDMLLKDPRKWDKMTQSLSDYLTTLELSSDEQIYLKSFKLSSKEEVVKYIIKLDIDKKKKILINFEKLINEIIEYLF